jgi:transposase-like protein
MNPQAPCCHNPQCPARGPVGRGNMRVHSQVEQCYRCTRCGQTSAATKGTPFSRLRTAADLVMPVLTLLCHGCPIHALVAAFGLDERTVASWLRRAGQHGQQVQQSGGQQGQVDRQHVQADELWVKLVGRRVWMAMALAVPSRPRLVLEQGLRLGQVVKRYGKRRVASVEHRVVRGTEQAIAAVLTATHTGTGINTADIERLNATFRASLAPLVRRGRAIAHTQTALTAGMYLVGCAYNCCWLHESLRVAAPAGAPWKWQERTPAMAAGLTNHRWTMRELFHYQVPPPPWVAPKRPGRPPKRVLQPVMTVAT